MGFDEAPPRCGVRQPNLKALGPLAGEDWLTVLDGPAPPVTSVTVAGTAYRLVHVCKNHDCADDNMTLLTLPLLRYVRALGPLGLPTLDL